MSSNRFNIDKSSGSDNTIVNVTVRQNNVSSANYAATLTVTGGNITKSVNVKQYYKPRVKWENVDGTPLLPLEGGELQLTIECPYVSTIYKCPSNVSPISEGMYIPAGKRTINLNIGSVSKETVEEIQISFLRADGVQSYDTPDGRDGFKVSYEQLDMTPFEVTGLYDIDGNAVALPLSALSREYYLETNAVRPIEAATLEDFVTIDGVEDNRVFFTLDDNVDNDGYRGFTIHITDGRNTIMATYEQLNVYADVEYVYDNGEITTGEDEYGRPIIGRFSDEFGMSFITDVAGGYLDFDVEADDEYPFRGYDYDEDLDRYIIYITKNYSGSDRVLRVSIMDGNGSMITKTEILQEG